jgi:uncharacterized membrane protein
MISASPWPEIIMTGAAFIILLLYHVHLVYQIHRAPLSTSFGLTSRLRREWVQMVMEEKRDILAVQTLRNWVMASSFLASTAILIGLGALSVAFKTDKIGQISHALNLFGSRNEAVWLIKVMVLSTDFLFAFFNFTLSIRYYNHASYALNVSPSDDPIVTYEAVAKIINHGTTHYTLGMRGYYFAVPLTLWLFGPFWMLGGAIFMTFILYKLDRTA